MKIAITGVTGFVGGHLVRRLSAKGHQVIGVGRQATPPKALAQLCEYVQADVSQPIPNIDCDIAIHSAGLASDRGSYDDFYQANVKGTEHFYQATHSAKRFIQISSASVYPLTEKIIQESDALLETCPSIYGKTKMLAEDYLLGLTDNKPKLLIRPRAIYGANDRVILPRILNMAKRGKITVPGDLRVNISMTHIDNLMDAIELGFDYDAPQATVLNVCDEEVYSLRDIVTKLIEKAHKEALPVRSLSPKFVKTIAKIGLSLGINMPFTPQSIDYVTNSTVLDLSKTKATLGYKAQTDFWKEVDGIVAWVDSVGLEQVKAGGKELAWV